MAARETQVSWKRRPLAGRRACRACAGAGLFAPATPSCSLRVPGAGWTVVERCDACERFPDDFEAAQSLSSACGWFQCGDGGWHAMAARPSGRGRGGKRGLAASPPVRRAVVGSPGDARA
jgi:hypothetical protein